MNQQDDDKWLFRKIFGDIERIPNDRIEYEKQQPKIQSEKRIAAHGNDVAPSLPSTGFRPDIENYHFRASGVQDKLMRKLKRGQLPPEAILDLHGHTLDQALITLEKFIIDCQKQGIRVAVVIHGKGNSSKNNKAVLKPNVARWLQQMKPILAYCPALPQDGGSGALYTLIRRLKEK